MGCLVTGRVEARQRRSRLAALRRAVVWFGGRARFARGVTGPAYLLVRGCSGRVDRVLCVGAVGSYTFVTEGGRLLGAADEAGIDEAAKGLVWLLGPPASAAAEAGR